MQMAQMASVISTRCMMAVLFTLYVSHYPYLISRLLLLFLMMMMMTMTVTVTMTMTTTMMCLGYVFAFSGGVWRHREWGVYA
jgi:hypothetical protein